MNDSASMLSSQLKKLGLKSGDTVCVFSDLTSIGLPDDLRPIAHQKGVVGLCQKIISTIQEILGPDGTLLMPTFTYSACRNEVFVPEQTPSTVGLLTEVFRQMPNSQRSEHPIFSFAGTGSRASFLLNIEDWDCFSSASFFGKMKQVSGKYLLFGTTLQSSATFVYHSLQEMNVPYRQMKLFDGTISKGTETKKVTVPYFVRRLELGLEQAWDGLQETACKNAVIKTCNYGSGNLLLMESGSVHSFVCQEVSKNPSSLVRKEVP